MSFFQHFFYGVERAEPVEISLPLMIAILALWIGVMVFIVLFRKQLASQKDPGRLARVLAVILLADQIVLYLWQFLSGYFNVELSLPLYHCRICVWLLILDLIFGVKVLRHIWVYWAFLGSFFSMAFMDLYRFDFPHYTNFQFFIVHLLIGWLVFYVIFAMGYRFEKRGLKIALLVTTLYNVGLIFFNGLCNGTFLAHENILFNYGYMSFPPGPLKDFALSFPPLTFNLLMLAGYNLLIFLLYLGGRALNRISDRNGLAKAAGE
jgi:hypothetical integral membrane protein (TIGR02206 family)